MTVQNPRPALGKSPSGEPIQVFLAKTGAPRRPRVVRGEGIYFWDDQGQRYLDTSSGPVANNLGSGNPRVLEAMRKQAEAVAFAFPGQFESEANENLANLLTSLAGPGLDRAFFVSGGSEATESAIKFCRQYFFAKGETARCKMISREPGYHGGTLGALAVTGDERQHEIFGPLLREMPKVPTPFTYRLPPNHTRESYARHCAEALEARIVAEGPETVMAFIMEPVGGLATGALVAEDIYFSMVREICTRHGVLLIFDEVMSGAGRTGKFLAADYWPDARPDLVILAKGIAAGYTPMGCLLAPAEMVRVVADSGGFVNGFTYFSNPLSCAIGHAVLQEMVEHDLIAKADIRGRRLKDRLNAIADRSRIIGDVRGLGLLLAMEFVSDKAEKTPLPLELNAPLRFQTIAAEFGLAVYCRRTSGGVYGDWLMISPPLIITDAEVDELSERLEKALAAFERELASEGVLKD
ncbi:aspartate aminotransferase family protein [Pikeienuella sp. HZG-20]|uniref:aminotransferase family protein n=1 Tax=Paludibacillus litoralis TaxID=3133267 RepID=UPI0030ED591B